MNAIATSQHLADDDFVVLGLPRKFALDTATLDAKRRELQAQVHPDRHVGADPATQRLAMQWSLRVNEAWQRLRDPVKRAAYLCAIQGAPVDAEWHTAMPADFLVQQMQWRESLEDATDIEDLTALLRQVDHAQRERLERVRELLDDRSDAKSAVGDVRALLFLVRFKGDVEQRLDAAG